MAILCKIGYNLTFWTAGGVAGIRGKQLIFAGPVIPSGTGPQPRLFQEELHC